MPVSGIPDKPVLDSNHDGKVTPEERLNYSEASQERWFALNAAQNQQNQEATSKSNMQKADHDAMMEVIRNLK